MSEREQRFLEQLWKLQADMGLSDGAFSELLGVDRALIAQTRKRKRLGKTLLVAACDRFPRLRELYFAQRVPTGTILNANQPAAEVA